MPNCAVYGCFESTTKRVGEGAICDLHQGTEDHQSIELQPPVETNIQVIRDFFETSEDFEAPLKKKPFIKFYGVPKGKLGETWKLAGGRAPEEYGKNSTFCSKHFEKKAYKMNMLKTRGYNLKGIRILRDDATPTLCLPKKRTRTVNQQNREKRLSKRNRCAN